MTSLKSLLFSLLVVLAASADAHAANATVRLGALSAIYNGSPKAVTVATIPAGLATSVTYDGSNTPPTNAGSYAVVATVTDPNFQGTATGTLVIKPAAAKVVLSNLSAVHDGNAHPVTVTTTPPGLSFSETYNGGLSAPVSAGSYAVVVTLTNSNYTGSAKGTLVIKKQPIIVTLSNLTPTYDGTPKTPTATTVPNGIPVTFTYGRSTTAPTNVGSYAVVATVNDPDYSGSVSGTLVIGKATATVTLGSLAANYDGAAHPATATTNPAGLKVTFTYNGKPTVPSTGGSYSVVGTISDANYTGSASGTLVISPGAATITLGANTYTYTGTGRPATSTTNPARLAVSYTYNGSATPPVAVGTYNVVATIANPNYTGTANGTLTITAVAPTATTNAATLVTAGSAVLNAAINPKSSTTTMHFEYGLTTAYGINTPNQNVGNGTVSLNASASITVPTSTAPVVYHYRVVATNIAGGAAGSDRTFATVPIPSVGNTSETVLAATGAEVTFSVNPNGSATSVYVEYGTTTAYGLTTPVQSLGSGKSAISYFAFITGLPSNTLVHYRLVTTGPAGTIPGPDMTFTTLAFDTTLAAQVGDAAVGTPSTFATFGNPAVITMLPDDGTAFYATLAPAAGITGVNNIGIWADDATGTRHLIAQTGTSAPGTGGNYLTLSDPLYNDFNKVAYRATLKPLAGQVLSTNAVGIWANLNGGVQLVARQGSAAPGTTSTFNNFTSLGLSDVGVVLLATINPGVGITPGNNLGIWEGTTQGDLALVLRSGQTVGGKVVSGLSFFPTNDPNVGGQTRSFNINGDLAGQANFDRTAGLVKVVNGVAEIDQLAGDVAPGAGAAKFASFGSPIINVNGNTAFAASLSGVGVNSTNSGGIWADDSTGTRQLILRSGDVAPGTNGATFISGSDPVYNDSSAVALRATLKVAAGKATPTTAIGIWATDGTPNSLALVARQGSQAPGCPTGATFATFTQLELSDAGVAFIGTLNANATAGVTSSSNLGIWAYDDNNNLQLVVRTGDILGGKIVTNLAFLPSTLATVGGQSRSYSDSGSYTYLATFSDKTTGIYTVGFF